MSPVEGLIGTEPALSAWEVSGWPPSSHPVGVTDLTAPSVAGGEDQARILRDPRRNGSRLLPTRFGLSSMRVNVAAMATEQARVVQLACDFLHSYMTRDGGLVPSDAQYVELTEGNFLTADAIAGMLAKLRGRSFNQVLDELPKRDEGYPPDPAATAMWATAVAQLKNVHVHGCKAARPQPPRDYALPTAFRSSFNLVVALAIEFAAETDKSARQLAKLLRDAAPAEMRQTPSAPHLAPHPVAARS